MNSTASNTSLSPAAAISNWATRSAMQCSSSLSPAGRRRAEPGGATPGASFDVAFHVAVHVARDVPFRARHDGPRHRPPHGGTRWRDRSSTGRSRRSRFPRPVYGPLPRRLTLRLDDDAVSYPAGWRVLVAPHTSGKTDL